LDDAAATGTGQSSAEVLGVRALARAGNATGASQPVRVLPRPPFLAGREELLAGLDARLNAADVDGPRVVALCGLGGAGKTSVALE
jgi:hypothetical protein